MYVFFYYSIQTSQATRSQNDDDGAGGVKAAKRGASPRRGKAPAAARPAGKEAPSAPSRPAPVTSGGVSGTYVTPRGRGRCCFPPPPSFPRPRNSLTALGHASARRRRRHLPAPPQVLPAPPPASRREAPLPQPHHLPPGKPPSPPGSPQLPTWPRRSV